MTKMLPDKLSVLQYRRVHIRYYSAGKTGIEHIFLQNKIIKHYRKVRSIPTTTMRKKLHEWKICSLLMDGVCVFTGFRCDVMQWISSMCVRWNNRPEICVFFYFTWHCFTRTCFSISPWMTVQYFKPVRKCNTGMADR